MDIGACTRRGIWVTNVMSRWPGKEAEIEAARNILDVLSGETPRGALNEILPTAAYAAADQRSSTAFFATSGAGTTRRAGKCAAKRLPLPASLLISSVA